MLTWGGGVRPRGIGPSGGKWDEPLLLNWNTSVSVHRGMTFFFFTAAPEFPEWIWISEKAIGWSLLLRQGGRCAVSLGRGWPSLVDLDVFSSFLAPLLVSAHCFTPALYPRTIPDFSEHSLLPRRMQLDIMILYDQLGEDDRVHRFQCKVTAAASQSDESCCVVTLAREQLRVHAAFKSCRIFSNYKQQLGQRVNFVNVTFKEHRAWRPWELMEWCFRVVRGCFTFQLSDNSFPVTGSLTFK